MFESLSDRLGTTLDGLRSQGRLSEEDIQKAMREIRLALLEADVNFGVVRDFVAKVRERAMGAEVMESLTPGQQVVKIVHEELTTLMGSAGSGLSFANRPPTVILMAGLQGAGKTTMCGKLARLLAKQKRSPAMVACDLQRPAAVQQLQTLGQVPAGARLRPRHRRRPRRGAPSGVWSRPGRRAATSSSSTPPAACTSTRS